LLSAFDLIYFQERALNISGIIIIQKDVEQSVVGAIDESLPFEIETDASQHSLAATLNQNGRPVAFFTRMRNGSEIK